MTRKKQPPPQPETGPARLGPKYTVVMVECCACTWSFPGPVPNPCPGCQTLKPQEK